ncbi:hypothetical protein F5Y04DRAFT_23702 [Hypomontagnella monticulosa]|nr:hypothetical protein F5Y04DRAFT_23702 [Hypomontagnella monticulosa]
MLLFMSMLMSRFLSRFLLHTSIYVTLMYAQQQKAEAEAEGNHVWHTYLPLTYIHTLHLSFNYFLRLSVFHCHPSDMSLVIWQNFPLYSEPLLVLSLKFQV